MTAALAGRHWETAWTGNFDDFWFHVVGKTRCLDGHIITVAWSKTTTTESVEFLFGLSNFFTLMVVFEVGFELAAQQFLTPTTAGMPDF